MSPTEFKFDVCVRYTQHRNKLNISCNDFYRFTSLYRNMSCNRMLWFWCRPDILHGTLCYICGILQCLPGCRQIQLRGVAFIVITRQHFNFNYSKNSPYPSKVQVNVVYVWGSKQNQCLLYFQKHDSRL